MEETTDRHDDFTLKASENTVEYVLLLVGHEAKGIDALSELKRIQKSAEQLSTSLAADYIWQRDEFHLELKTDQNLTYLHGSTDYGDAVEDEWLIVYLLRDLSKSHANLWIRVFDSDGEFLLVEAANVLPKWLNPEIDRNRVWIHKGQLLLVPTDGGGSPTLSLPEAVRFIKETPKKLVHSPLIEEEAFYRLGKYPQQIKNSIHHSQVTIPRKLATVLQSLPKTVAPAVEHFYLRDPPGLKKVLSPSEDLIFPPEDLVTTSVCFSKVLFAQLRSQRFDPPPRWQDHVQKAKASAEAKDASRVETGMKLTCGFEIMAQGAEDSSRRIVRESAILVQDIEEDGVESLPTNEDMSTWKDNDRDDDETWLDINYEDFERELEGKASKSASGSQTKSGFGDARVQADLRKMVSRFEDFLNDDNAGIDGADLDDMDVDDDSDDEGSDSELDSGEDREVSFDEEEFSRMMREMMGLPAESKAKPPKEDHGKSKPKGSQDQSPQDEDEETREIRNITSQLEAELNQHGALKLDAPKSEQRKLKGKQKATDTNTPPQPSQTSKPEDEDEDSDAGSEDVDIDYNLAKNLLESFKGQAGMAGPTGNLLGMMGFQLPRDEDDGEDDGKGDKAGPS